MVTQRSMLNVYKKKQARKHNNYEDEQKWFSPGYIKPFSATPNNPDGPQPANTYTHESMDCNEPILDPKLSVDFSIFNETDTHCTSVSKCKCIHRVIAGLLYYQLLNKTTNTINNNDDNKHGQIIFSDFLYEIYKHYLDDIIHLTTHHALDLEEINNLLLRQADYKPCDINNCVFTDRHCKINDKIKCKSESTNSVLPIHQQIWDNIHYFLVHIFEIGLRQKQCDLKNDDHDTKNDDDDKTNNWGYLDKNFKSQRLMIESKRKRFNNRFYGRFQKETNKFTIAATKKTDFIAPPSSSPTNSMYSVCN